MLIAESHISFVDGRPHLEVRQTRGLLDVLSVLAYELGEAGCERYNHALCLFNPPRWAAWIGGPAPFDLDTVWAWFGQTVDRRRGNLPLSYQMDVEWEDLPALGWDPGTVSRVRRDIVEAHSEES